MRTFAAVLALFYAGLSTQAFLHVADALAPVQSVAKVGDFPCAGHRCGCATAEACRTQCCCFPRARAVERSCCHKKKAAPPYSFVNAAACKGGDRQELQHISLPMALPEGEASTILVEGDGAALRDDRMSMPVDRHPPDKVPIAASSF